MAQSLRKVSRTETKNGFLPHQMKNKTVLILLCSIFAVGCILRFYGLSSQSLWTDELASWYISSKQKLSDVIAYTAQKDTYPPGYYIFLHLVIKYIGDSETVLRFPSACAGSLSILMIFLMGLRLYGHKEGIIAAAFMAVLWCPVYYSQEARAYSFLILFTLTATYFWITTLTALQQNRKPEKICLLSYIVFATISCYLHYFGLYLIALQGLGSAILFFKNKRGRFYIIALYSSIAVAFGPWLPAFWQHLHVDFVGTKELSPSFFVKFLGHIFNAQKSRSLPLREYSIKDIVISTTIIAVVLLSLSTVLIRLTRQILKKNYRNIREIILLPDVILFLWLIAPFLGMYILAIFSISAYGYLYFLISLPPAYLLFTRSITQLPISWTSKKIFTISLLVMSILHLMLYLRYTTQPHKYQYREAFNYVRTNQGYYRDAKIIFYGWEDTADYYFRGMSYEPSRKIVVSPKNESEKDIYEIISPFVNHIWVICAHVVPDDEFFSHFDTQYKLVSTKEFFGAKVWLFKRRWSS